MEKVIAVALAGGCGRRIDILCHERPEPALPFAGRFRVIDFSLSNCLHSQINGVAVLTDYQRSNMANYLKQLILEFLLTSHKLGAKDQERGRKACSVERGLPS
jgi:ADP-glucose pyrophosphorylase